MLIFSKCSNAYGESKIMKNLIACVFALLIFSAALLSAASAQNQAGYATTSSNTVAAGTTASSNMTNIPVTGNASTQQINPEAKSTYVTQLANVSAIFGSNKAEDLNITNVNTVGNRWVEIANEGIAAWNMSGWRLVNRENTTYVFPAFNLEAGSIARVHEGSGISAGMDLYTNSTAPLFNNSGDMITLLDPAGETAATYTLLGNASAAAPGTAPAPANATATGLVRNPATQPVLITPATPGVVKSPGTAPLLVNNTLAVANATGNVCSAGQTLCNGTCVDTSIDSQNCGKCGNICPPETSCINGACSSPCLPGQTSCNGTCVDTSSDSLNCGACGKRCPPDAVCINGVCSTALSNA